jgi:hypothetical protein
MRILFKKLIIYLAGKKLNALYETGNFIIVLKDPTAEHYLESTVSSLRFPIIFLQYTF